MSTAVPALAVEAVEDRPGVLGRVVALCMGPTAWSLVDQAVVSLGNFVTTILVVRSLLPRECGLFGILLDVTLFLNSIHAPLLTYPLSVRGAATDRATTARLTFASLALTLLAGLLLIATGCVAGWITGSPAPVIWASVSAVMWQLQEVARRGLIARMRVRTAVAGDSVSFLGQAFFVGLLFHFGGLSLSRVFMAMSLTSAAAVSLQVIQVGWAVLSVKEIGASAKEFWQMGRWLLAGNLTGLICIPAFAWVLVYFHGLEEGAINLALLSLLKISHPVMSAVSNLIIPAVAHARAKAKGEAFAVFVKQAAVGAALLTPLFVPLLIVPSLVLKTVYAGGNARMYSAYSGTMQAMALSYVLIYLANMTTAYLTGLQKTRDVFVGHVANTAGSMLIGLPMVALWGVTGAAWGGGIAVAARLAANAISIRRSA